MGYSEYDSSIIILFLFLCITARIYLLRARMLDQAISMQDLHGVTGKISISIGIGIGIGKRGGEEGGTR